MEVYFWGEGECKMNYNGFWPAVNSILEWVMWVAYLNLIWILFTIMGLVIFGWCPATTALYSTWRKLLREDGQIKVFKEFSKAFNQNFLNSNIMNIIIILWGTIILTGYLFFQE